MSQWQPAHLVFSLVLKVSPSSTVALLCITECSLKLGLYEDALRHAARFIQQVPHTCIGRLKLAEAYALSEKLLDAEAACLLALQWDGTSEAAVCLLLHIRVQLASQADDVETCLEHLESASKLTTYFTDQYPVSNSLFELQKILVKNLTCLKNVSTVKRVDFSVKSASPVRIQTDKQFFSYEALKGPGPYPGEVDATCREAYLEDRIFEELLKMDRVTFSTQPKVFFC